MRKKWNSFIAKMLVSLLVISMFLPTAAFANDLNGEKDYGSYLDRLGLESKSVSTEALPLDKQMKSEHFEKDMLVVKYNKVITAADHRALGTSLVKKVGTLQYDVVKVEKGKAVESVIAAYLKRNDVASVSLSAKVYKQSSPDPKRAESYHLDSVKADEAVKLAGKNKVRVAVVDSGLDANHPELKNKIVFNYNVLDPMKKGSPDLHGTHVAGIIAAEKGNGLGGYGVNPNVEIIAIDVFNNSYYSNDYTIADGILKAVEQKAQVINLSLGSYAHSPIIEDAVKKAVEANITLVAAAGNSGSNMKMYPASYDGVISVGAVDRKNELTDFSTYGPYVDVVAPGAKVYSSAYNQKGSTYMELDGTSMATPVVSGVVSLLLSKNSKLTPSQIKYILTKTTTDLGDKGLDIKYGYGLVNAQAAMKFDASKIPNVEVVKENQLLKQAKKIDVTDESSQRGAMTKLNQVDLYQFKVEQDAYYQILLQMANNYQFDYGYQVYFFKDGETDKAAETFYVNDQGYGLTEGNLFHAKESGTLVIGVKDATKKYYEAAKDSYLLTVKKEEVKEDGLSEDNPIEIKKLPFNSKTEIGDLYFTNQMTEVVEEKQQEDQKRDPRRPHEGESEYRNIGDRDYFTFSLPETANPLEAIKISVSDVPGINSSINLYLQESFEMDGETYTHKYLYDYVNRNGFGKGEELIFSGMPGVTYTIEVTNSPLEYWMWEYYYYFENELDLKRSYSSAVPYQLTIDTRVLPEDEDQFPMAMYHGGDNMKEEYYEEAVQQNTSVSSIFLVEELFNYYNDSEYYQMIESIAIPFELNDVKTGYFQYLGDEDWYTFETTKTGLYEFPIASNSGTPVFNLFQKSEKSGDFLHLASNRQGWYYDDPGTEKLVLGLKGGQTYYLRLSSPSYRPSFDEYSFAVNFMLESPRDQYEDNDSLAKAKDIRVGKLTANFATVQDVDIFYFKPDTNGIYAFHVDPSKSRAVTSRIPKESLLQLDPILVLIEDTNGNKKLDPAEEGNFRVFDSGWWGDDERGSFVSQKGKGYFIAIFDYYGTTSFLSYDFTLYKAEFADEDHGSVVKNNVPSKPIKLQSDRKGNLFSSAYMNVTTNKGDTDFFELVVTENQQKFKITLDVPSDLDGVVTLYEASGKELIKKDDYGRGDAEVFYVNLKKGTYYLKVEDKFGNASITPYQLKLEK